MRVVAGKYRGRRIAAPEGSSTRPTSDRVREALFSSIESRLSSGLRDAVVLDAYAGSGALGIEALSRGAAMAVFVERDARALKALRANVSDLDLRDHARVVAGDVLVHARHGRIFSEPFSLILLDPPYRIVRAEVRGLIEALTSAGAIAEGALIVWEHASADEPDWPDWVTPVSERRYGSTTVSIGEAGRA